MKKRLFAESNLPRDPSPWRWLRRHKWGLLLLVLVILLIISPFADVFDRQDNMITPVMAAVFLAVILGTVEKKRSAIILIVLTLLWLFISVATAGSGLFAGMSLAAPILFMILLLVIFALLVRWMSRAPFIDAEVIFAAICGYVLLGILWTGFYAISAKMRLLIDPSDLRGGFSSPGTAQLAIRDLLYFSYTTLTTTGFGDIVPRGPEVRMLAVVEAMVGVFYNTIVIARFVGLYGIRRER